MKWILKPARFFWGIVLSLFLFTPLVIGAQARVTLKTFRRLMDLAIDSADRIYVTDDLGNQVIRIDDISGKNAVALGSPGSGAGQLVMPTGMAIDAQDRIYLFDQLNNRLVRFNDMRGQGFTAFGTQGTGTGQFNSPAGVGVDSKGRIYVNDAYNGRIVRMDDISGAGWTVLQFSRE